MKNLKNLVLSAVLMFGSIIPGLAVGSVAYAQTGKEAVCAGVNTQAGGSQSCDGNAAGDEVSNVIRVAIRIFQAVIGVISVFVMIIAGLNYITSGGDSSKTKTAKDRILYATIGLVVVGLAQVIITFVINRINGANDLAPTTTP